MYVGQWPGDGAGSCAVSRQALSDGYRTLGTSGGGPRGGGTRHLSARRTATVLSRASEGMKEE